MAYEAEINELRSKVNRLNKWTIVISIISLLTLIFVIGHGIFDKMVGFDNYHNCIGIYFISLIVCLCILYVDSLIQRMKMEIRIRLENLELLLELKKEGAMNE